MEIEAFDRRAGSARPARRLEIPRRLRRLRRLGRRGDPFRRFYNLYARLYDQVFGPALHDGRIRSIELLDPLPGERILEVGVGTGLTLPLYGKGVRVEGIDTAEKMLRIARRRRDRLPRWAAAPSVSLCMMNAARLAYGDETFDAVVANYVLTAVTDPVAVLGEIRRVLRPHGRLVVVNRIRARHPVLRRAEESFSGLFEQVGFSIDVDVTPLMLEAGFRIDRAEKVNGFGHFKAIVARKD